MRILFISDNYPPERNAAATRVSERARYWIEMGHQVTVITCHPNFPEGRVFDGHENVWKKRETLGGVDVVRVKTFIAPNAGVILRIIDFLSFMLMSLLAGIREPRHDVVIATSPQFFSAVSGWLVAKVRGRPFIFELSDLWPASVTAVGVMKKNIGLTLVERLELFLYRQATRVVALTHSFKENLVRRGIPPEKIDVVINGVDLRRYEKRPKDTVLAKKLGLEDCFVIGYIGTHGLAHALENVVHAAHLLRDHPKVRFLFVGPGAARTQLVSLAKTMNVPNTVFVEAQPKEAMPAYWSLCDVALVHLKNTSVFETVIPSKIFEAMGMGLPILMAAPRGEATRILDETRSGFWVPPEDPLAFSQIVKTLADRPELLEQTADNSRRSAALFTRERQARDFLSSCEKALAQI